MNERYDLELTSAYLRGYAMLHGLPQPEGAAPEQLAAYAQERGIRLHYFKRQEELPRVRWALGFLRGVAPESLLDVGSGRGVFLLPFLRQFPGVPVTSLELREDRAELLRALALGGGLPLTVLRQDVCAWDGGPEDGFDCVCALEVLEHIPQVEQAVRQLVRLARRWVVVSVPSKPDNNPEHIHLLTKARLTELFEAAGCGRLRFDAVPDHLVMTASTGRRGT